MAEDDPEAAALKADVDEMERMVDGFLAFARGEEGEKTARIDLLDLVESIVETESASGRDIRLCTVLIDQDFHALLRPDAIRRCIQNLVGNALKYGNAVEVTLEASDQRLSIIVEDDGPGIPEDQREEAFKPFQRLDPARNMDSGGGSGLGLSIVLDAARAHGGDILLGQSRMGGLKATLLLPR